MLDFKPVVEKMEVNNAEGSVLCFNPLRSKAM
jgi:hypothetical protein